MNRIVAIIGAAALIAGAAVLSGMSAPPTKAAKRAVSEGEVLCCHFEMIGGEVRCYRVLKGGKCIGSDRQVSDCSECEGVRP